MRDETIREKFTVALNKRIPESILSAASVIACVKLVASCSMEERELMRFLNFVDAAHNDHQGISALSLIVMRGKSGELGKFNTACNESQFIRSAYVTRHDLEVNPSFGDISMIGQEQEFIAVAAFGEIPALSNATGRLSLWK